MVRFPVIPSQSDSHNNLRAFIPDVDARTYPLDLSVVIPTYNRAKRLSGLLDAWLQVDAFTSLKYELIFSDDGSEDETLEILRSFQSQLPIRILTNRHAGPAQARNSGITAASGRRVLFLGDDIYPAANLLDVHVSLGNRLGDHVAILGKVDWHPDQEQNHLCRHITEIGHEQFSFNVLAENRFTDYRHFYTCNVSVSNAMLTREATKFDQRFSKANFEDIELAYRLSAHGMQVYYAPAAFAHHFHEYDVERFSRRQEIAGEMANVFVALHPELDQWLRLSDLKRQYVSYHQSQEEQTRPQTQLPQVLKKCQQLEEELKSTPGDTKKQNLLSLLYRQLFQLKFAAGVLAPSESPDESSLQHFLYDRYFGREYFNQLCSLTIAGACEQPVLSGLKLLQFYLRLLGCSLLPVKLGEASELISSSFRNDIQSSKARPDLKQLALHKTKAYLAQFPVLRKLRQRLRTLSMEQFRRKITLEKPDSGSLPCVAVLSEEPISSSVRQEYHRELGAAVLFVNKTDRGYEYHSDKIVGITDDLHAVEFSYVLQIRNELELPRLFHFKNVLLSLATYWYDYVLISFSYQSEPIVGIRNLSAQLFLKRNLYFTSQPTTVRHGRMIRLLPAPEGTEEVSLDAILSENAPERRNLNQHLKFKTGRIGVKAAQQINTDFLTDSGEKPVVFVFPVYMAVGGAERNIIAVMNELQDEYHFVVITMAKHTLRQGSLHHQIEEFTNDMYDLAEIASTHDFLKILQSLKQKFDPQLLLITNGSPWLLSRSKKIRELFAEIPIVDHQVYDQRTGWIEHYTDSGIQSFDCFVAINQKIQTVMQQDKGIAPNRIRQIYHAVDTERIRQFSQAKYESQTVCQKYGLPQAADKYIYLARLDSQKRPLKFLEMLKTLQEAGRPEFFIMVGNGELEQDVDEFIHSHLLTNVLRIPFVNNPLELIALSKGMLFTSAFEGLPVAMLEALSLGVPVLSTDVGDVRRVLDHYAAGMTVPVDFTTQESVQYFYQFLDQRDQYANNLSKSREQIIERFSAESIAAQYNSLFRDYMHLKKGA